MRARVKISKHLVCIYIGAMLLCGLSALLGFLDSIFWLVTGILIVFLSMSLSASLVAVLIWLFSKKVCLRGSMWGMCLLFALFVGWRCYYDWFIYDGWFKGLEALGWLCMGVPPITLTMGYLIYTSLRKRGKKHDDCSE